MTNQVLALRDHLAVQQVSVVVMEATGDYWRPFYYLLEADFQVMLVNAHSVRNVPGRKTDVSDAAWLADRVPTDWCGPRSCRRNRSASYGT